MRGTEGGPRIGPSRIPTVLAERFMRGPVLWCAWPITIAAPAGVSVTHPDRDGEAGFATAVPSNLTYRVHGRKGGVDFPDARILCLRRPATPPCVGGDPLRNGIASFARKFHAFDPLQPHPRQALLLRISKRQTGHLTSEVATTQGGTP